MLKILLFLWYAERHFLSCISFLHTAENPALCLPWFQTFSGKIFNFFLTLHSDLQHSGWMCLFDISKIYLVHKSFYFHLTSPLLTTTTYHLLHVLHIVRFASVGIIMNIKNRDSNENTYTPLCCTFLRQSQHCIISQMQPHFHLASNLAVLKRLLLWICFLCNLAVHFLCLNTENLCKILTSICHTPVDLPFSLKFPLH